MRVMAYRCVCIRAYMRVCIFVYRCLCIFHISAIKKDYMENVSKPCSLSRIFLSVPGKALWKEISLTIASFRLHKAG